MIANDHVGDPVQESFKLLEHLGHGGFAHTYKAQILERELIEVLGLDVVAMKVPLDILICNAGIFFRDYRQVRDLEMHFVVNHLGHFILVNRLQEEVIAAPQGRVVVVSSNSHRRAPADGIRFDDLSGHNWTTSGYSHSKLANGLFSLELARRFEGTDATSNSLHPGVVDTNMLRSFGPRPRSKEPPPRVTSQQARRW